MTKLPAGAGGFVFCAERDQRSMNENFDENENIDEEEQYDEYAELDRFAEQAGQIGDTELRDEFVRLKKREKKTALFFGIGMIVMFVLVIVMIVLTVVRIRYAKSLQDRLDSMTASEETEKDFEDVLKKLDNINNFISTYFLFDGDISKTADALYHTLLESLGDPYSVYYSPEEYQKMSNTSDAVYVGIGITVTKDTETGYVRVYSLADDSSAAGAGIKVDDLIMAINGVSVVDRELSDITADMKGEEGTEVTLTVYRPDEDRTFDVSVKRKRINYTTAAGTMLEGDIGYIVITRFGEDTPNQFKEAVEKLKAEGAKGIIIDVRENPGGQLSSVSEIMDYLLPKGIMVYTEDKYGNRHDYESKAGCVEMPMAVLINENTASAAEIFAGALQDYGWATIIGTTSYGKGIVQTIHTLGDGSAVKVTVSKYFTPNGRSIHGVGIEPDIKLEYKEDETVDDWKADNQALKAYEILMEEIK